MNASRQSFIVSAAICVLLAALFVARYLVAPWPVEAPSEGGMPLADALTRFSASMPWIAAAIAGVVALWTLLATVRLTVKYAPAGVRNYLPPQLLMIGAAGVVVSDQPLAALAAMWLAVLAAGQFVFSFHKWYRFSEVFHAGFYLGLLPLLYAPAVVLILPVAIAALVIYRRSGREAVVCLAGLALPIPAAGFIHRAMGDPEGHIYRELWRCTVGDGSRAFGVVEDVMTLPIAAAVVAGGVATLALVAIAWTLSHKKSIRKTQYKFVQHSSLALLFAAGTAALPGSGTTLVPLLAVPCAMCATYAFQGRTAGVSTAIYLLTLVAVSALSLLPVLGITIL
ncbi:MAG: hypothetical protein LBU97_01430 [Alistipes sp.]|jgi:hypothetical protein|nr:hypothetical protein [Alistipes sp.]